MTRSTTLYRLYDAEGGLLYIGIAGNPGRRFEDHAGSKPWWGQVARTELVHYPSRPEAMEAERQAIKQERPAHNVAHQPTQPKPKQQRPATQERANPIPGVSVELLSRAMALLPADRHLTRAIDDPVKLAKAAAIMRSALARNGLTLADLQ